MIILVRIVSIIASFFMLFGAFFPKEPPIYNGDNVLKEEIPVENEKRVAEKINGINGSVFYIERPSGSLDEVNISDFGADPSIDDNFPAFERAFEYCNSHPGTKLVIDEGTYYLDNIRPLTLNNTSDILIEGNGARVILSEVVVGILIHGCDGVEFNNIKFDWDADKLPLADIVEVKNASPSKHTLDLVFRDRETVDENTIFAAITQCDPETFTYGAKCSIKEVYLYRDADSIRSVKKTAENVLTVSHNGCMDNFANGDMFILRHYVYDTSFAIFNGESRNITFDGVSVFGYPGSGFVVSEKTSHFQLKNVYIGVEPSMKDRYHTSLGADAIHIVNSDGCFNISGCDISGQGDDALNVHDSLGVVESVAGNTVKLIGNALYLRVGDTLKFRDEKFNSTEHSAVITQLEYEPATFTYTLKFDRELTGAVKANYIAYNLSCCSDNYVIRDNYIHENRARGFLLQSPNGLCESNRFYKTEMQAIKVVMDISPGLWYEGTGVDSLKISGNTFEMCDYIATGEVITVGSNIAGKPAECEPFTNIEITDNTFIEFPLNVITVDNVNGFVFADNTVDAGKIMPLHKLKPKAYFGKYCSNIVFGNNIWKNCATEGIASAASADVWARINSGIATGKRC